jgi:hypothetical protein
MKVELKNKRNKVLLNIHSSEYITEIYDNDLEDSDTEFMYFEEDGYCDVLKYIKEQTEKICLELVIRDSFNLEYVKNQTDEICLAAVRDNGFSLQFVKNQTQEICLAAIKENPRAIKYVKNMTEEIRLAAAKK